MKFLKITLDKGSNGIIYPINYQAEIGNFASDHLYYDEEDNGYLILCIKDVDFVGTMIRDNVIEITRDEMGIISEANETRVENIKDEGKLRRIELKAKLNQDLTTDELKAIDIDDKDSVFETTKILKDRV